MFKASLGSLGACKQSETPNLRYFGNAVGGSIPQKIGVYHYFEDSSLFEKLSSQQVPVANYSYAQVHKTLLKTVAIPKSSLTYKDNHPPATMDQAQSVTIVYISKVFSLIYFSFQLIL